jgi:hypothetical protein
MTSIFPPSKKFKAKFGSRDEKFFGRADGTLARSSVIDGDQIHGTPLYSFSPKPYVELSWRVANEI